MNPIKIALLTLVGWIIVTIITLSSIPGGEAFATLFGSFYLAPVICMVAFIVSSLFYPSWVKKNKNAFAVTWILLIIWLLIVTIIFFTR